LVRVNASPRIELASFSVPNGEMSLGDGGAVDYVQAPMAVHLAVLVDHAVSAVDTHRDAAEAVHRDGPTQQTPGWCIRRAPA
jgi:hypothetical protein